MGESASAIASSLTALTEQYRSITNNLANASTPGFKRTRTSFQQLLDGATGQGPVSSSTAGQVQQASAIDFTQGVPTPTGRALDAALEGEGFFVLETPDGPLYTRCGKFRGSGSGQLVDPMGRLVSGDGGPISFPPTVGMSKIAISRDGTIRAGTQSLGKLRVVTFADPSQLTPVGQGCFRAPAGAEMREAENVQVHQGFVESSNVSVVEELVGLITVTRMYEANLKSVQVQDESMKNLLNVAMS